MQVFTPESAAEHPDAVRQLGVEFARAGADVTQTFSFWCHEDKLPKGCQFSVDEINQAACDIARKVARDKGTIVAAGVTQTGLFQGDGPKPSKHQIQAELRCAMEIYKKNDVELILCEVRGEKILLSTPTIIPIFSISATSLRWSGP